MTAEVVDAIPLSKDGSGVYRVGRSRVTLHLVVRAFNCGATPEEIAQDFPSLQLPDIYQVIGYYLKHGSELAEYFDRRPVTNERCWKRTRSSGRLVAFGSGCWPGVETGEVADENFQNAIIRGLLRQSPAFDVVRAQDVPEISGQDDSTVLRFATADGRVVVTHDLSTMIPAMQEQMRVESGCAPIVLVPDSLPVSAAIADLLVLDGCAAGADWAAGVIYIPLRRSRGNRYPHPMRSRRLVMWAAWWRQCQAYPASTVSNRSTPASGW